jgi:fatty acid desaturase
LGELGHHGAGGNCGFEVVVSQDQGSTAATLGRRRILADPQDRHCVIFHIACLVAYACGFWLYQHPRLAGITGPWSRVAFVLTTAVMLGWISGIDVGVNFHNHSHRSIFTSPLANRWFARFWTFSGGWPSFFWEYCHVTIHHARLLDADDWTLPKQNADGSFENFQRYLLSHWPWRLMNHLRKDLIARRNLRRKSLRELAIFVALWSIPFWIDPKMAIWLWLLPHWIANALVMASGMYVQHAGCVPKSLARPMSHSTTFVSKFFNLTMFNIGFHLEHHDNPRVHWSLLPGLHQRKKQEMIDGGAHVVPYGNYHASFLLAGDQARRKIFDEQALAYTKSPEPGAVPVAPPKEALVRSVSGLSFTAGSGQR